LKIPGVDQHARRGRGEEANAEAQLIPMLLELRQVVGDLEHGAFEPTKMCCVGRMLGASTSDPSAMRT
jgi:hypothetical protein